MTPKSINALMKIMRNSKSIQISGKTEKNKVFMVTRDTAIAASLLRRF